MTLVYVSTSEIFHLWMVNRQFIQNFSTEVYLISTLHRIRISPLVNDINLEF